MLNYINAANIINKIFAKSQIYLELFAPDRRTQTRRCLLDFRADSMTHPSLPLRVPILVKDYPGLRNICIVRIVFLPSGFKKKYVLLIAGISWNKFAP